MSNELRTLKTLLVEAALTYFEERGQIPFAIVHWKTLDALDGSIDVERDGENIVMNLSPAATTVLSCVNNKLLFSCRFDGKETVCVVPTASIQVIYDPNTGKGITYDATSDYNSEIEERGYGIPENNQVEERVPPKPPHLTVVKR